MEPLRLCREEEPHKRELYYVVILLENYVFICAERSYDVMLSSSSSTPPSMFTLSQRKQEIGALNAWCCTIFHADMNVGEKKIWDLLVNQAKFGPFASINSIA